MKINELSKEVHINVDAFICVKKYDGVLKKSQMKII